MKLDSKLLRILGISACCALLAGCLLKPVAVTSRRFVLSPVQTESPAVSSGDVAVGLGRVRMPEYLLKDSMAIRKGTSEIEYLENALWAERLDHSFQSVLAADLATHLSTARVRSTSWLPGEVALVIRVSVTRLDVDVQGHGTLVARWQVESAESGKVVKDGETRLAKAGASPFADPANIASNLSELTAQFSQVLAQAVRESATSSSQR
jgi:uncharacterized lipoprotein YmbA